MLGLILCLGNVRHGETSRRKVLSQVSSLMLLIWVAVFHVLSVGFEAQAKLVLSWFGLDRVKSGGFETTVLLERV